MPSTPKLWSAGDPSAHAERCVRCLFAAVAGFSLGDPLEVSGFRISGVGFRCSRGFLLALGRSVQCLGCSFAGP